MYEHNLDYLWGQPTELLLAALTGDDLTAVPTKRATYVQKGSV